MKITAKYAVQVSGYGIVPRGRTIDIAEEMVDERIAANFVSAVDGKPLKAAKPEVAEQAKPTAEDEAKQRIERVVASLGRNGLSMKLEQLGITFPAKCTTGYLAKLYLQNAGEIETAE